MPGRHSALLAPMTADGGPEDNYLREWPAPHFDESVAAHPRRSMDNSHSKPTLDPRTARRLITRYGRLPHAIGAMFAIGAMTDALGTPCLCEPLFFQDGLRIAAHDPGTPVKIKQQLEEISALCEEAGMAAGAKDQSHALPYWLVLLYNHNPKYFESASEGAFWVRNLPLASIEYCRQFAYSKPGRPKGGATFDPKILRGNLSQGIFAMSCGVSRATIQRLEYGSPLTQETSDKIRNTAESTLADSEATPKEKTLARKILKELGGPRK